MSFLLLYLPRSFLAGPSLFPDLAGPRLLRLAVEPATLADLPSPSDAASTYLRGLERGEALIYHSLAPSTQRQQQAAGLEANGCFLRLGLGLRPYYLHSALTVRVSGSRYVWRAMVGLSYRPLGRSSGSC